MVQEKKKILDLFYNPPANPAHNVKYHQTIFSYCVQIMWKTNKNRKVDMGKLNYSIIRINKTFFF